MADVPNRSRMAIGFASATIGALLWGFSGACIQYLTDNYEISALFITLVRSITASCAFIGAFATTRADALREMLKSRRAIAEVCVFGLSIFGSQFFYSLSISVTNAGTATILQMSYMVFIIIGTSIMARSLPSGRDLLAFVLAFAGVWMIATQGNVGVMVLPAIGLFFGLMNGFSAAMYTMWPKRLFERYGSFVPTGIAMCVDAIFTAILWIGSGLIGGNGSGFAIPELDVAGVLILIVGVGALGTFAAFTLYLKGVAVVGSVKGGLLGSFEPIGAMVISALWLGNAFTGYDWAGLLLMLIMLVIVTVKGPRTEKSVSKP